MKTYTVTVEIMGFKTYKITAENRDHLHLIIDQYNGLDNFTNPFEDSTYEKIVDIEEEKTTETKTETYERLRAYIENITENQEPLDLLERLKP